MSEIVIPVQQFLQKSFQYALVGASSDWQDHAYYLILEMEKVNMPIYPIHFQENQICGIPAFPNLISIPPVDVVIFCSKDDGENMKYLKEMRDSGLFRAWFEPGFFTPEMEHFAKENFFEVQKNFSLLEILQKRSL